MTEEHKQIPLSQDAALVLALAGTAMAFSHSAEDEAERWLRALRLHGLVGQALQALGVGESPLMTGSEPRPGARRSALRWSTTRRPERRTTPPPAAPPRWAPRSCSSP